MLDDDERAEIDAAVHHALAKSQDVPCELVHVQDQHPADGIIATAKDRGCDLIVMASYNSWHGMKMHANRELLTDVLKGRWSFPGFVVQRHGLQLFPIERRLVLDPRSTGAVERGSAS